MATNQYGMLGSMFSPSEKDLLAEQQAEEQRLQNLATDPFRAAAYTAYGAGKQIGQGIGELVSAATGKETPGSAAKVQMDKIAAAKAQVQKLGLNPEDPKSIDQFYSQVMKILLQQGLTAEAMAVRKEWREDQALTTKQDVAKGELARKVSNDAAKNAIAQKRNEIAAAKGGGPAVVTLLNELDRMYNSGEPIDPYREKSIMDQITALNTKAGNGNKWVKLGDRMALMAPDGTEITSAEMGQAPLSKKDEAKATATDAQAKTAYDSSALQTQNYYNEAVDLYNHPGLDDAIGPVHGIALQPEPGAAGTALRIAPRLGGLGGLSKEAVDFGANYKQVLGATFLTALRELKSASPTGASGLGNLSNMEGDKIQSAKAALSPLQYPASFRQNLAKYINGIANSWKVVTEGAGRLSIEPKPLAVKPLKGAPAATSAAPAVPPVAPTVPAAPAGPAKVERGPDGKLKLIGQ